MVTGTIKKVDILAIGVHPDDIELSCAGTLASHRAKGYSFGILDLTQGELGTRGTAEIRKKEAEAAAHILNAEFRVILDLKDGFFGLNEESIRSIIPVIRACKPELILTNAISDRHPDHGRAAQLVREAAFYSGLAKIDTQHEGIRQNPWRPRAVYHFVQDYFSRPDIVVDITGFVEEKMKAISAFESQFYKEGSSEPESPISGKDFFDVIRSRDRMMGRYLGVEFGEGFHCHRPLGTQNLFLLS
jgi:bacillithiol biosynthesis deacetylase BshB1